MGKMQGEINLKEELKEVTVALEERHAKSQKSLIRNIAATVIAAVILNAGTTFITTSSDVRRNTDRIERVERMTESQEELKEFVAALQIQYMYVQGGVQENKEGIKDVNEKIDQFINKYFSSATRGAAIKSSSNKH